MKLTQYQKRIVDKIIAGEVYDIPSYLRVFGEGTEQKYDPVAIQATFEEYENGSTYTFGKKEDNFFFAGLPDRIDTFSHTPPSCNGNTGSLFDNPPPVPVKAELDMKISPEKVSFGNKTFEIDFLHNKYLVANSRFSF